MTDDQRVRAAMLVVFLEATDDLPDDALDGIDALLREPALLREAAGLERDGIVTDAGIEWAQSVLQGQLF